MLTKVHGYDEQTIDVRSNGNSVRVRVPSDIDGLPDAPLSRSEIHDVLIQAKAEAEDFIAAVEGDIEATAH